MNELIRELRASRGMKNQDEVNRFERALESIAAKPESTLLPDLHLVLTDSTEQMGGMWGLVHLLESFDAAEQISAFLSVLPEMVREAPEWTQILHFRILNDPPSTGIYGNALAAAAAPNRDAANQLLNEISSKETGNLKAAAQALVAEHS